MSFVAGFVTGLTTGEAVERKKGRDHLREYMERQGYTVIDRQGRPIALNVIVEEALETKRRGRKKTLLIAGVAAVAIAAITGGTAWALVTVAN